MGPLLALTGSLNSLSILCTLSILIFFVSLQQLIQNRFLSAVVCTVIITLPITQQLLGLMDAEVIVLGPLMWAYLKASCQSPRYSNNLLIGLAAAFVALSRPEQALVCRTHFALGQRIELECHRHSTDRCIDSHCHLDSLPEPPCRSGDSGTSTLGRLGFWSRQSLSIAMESTAALWDGGVVPSTQRHRHCISVLTPAHCGIISLGWTSVDQPRLFQSKFDVVCRWGCVRYCGGHQKYKRSKNHASHTRLYASKPRGRHLPSSERSVVCPLQSHSQHSGSCGAWPVGFAHLIERVKPYPLKFHWPLLFWPPPC